MIPVICIVGGSGSVKTTLIEALIPVLKEKGYRVGTIKHDAHGFEMDHEGKDTWRHKKAGASIVLISSPQQLALIKDTGRDFTLEELRDSFISEVDMILVEGYKAQKSFPKIEVYRKALGKKRVCTGDPNLIAIVSDSPGTFEVPRFAPNDISAIAALIEQTLTTPSCIP